MKKAMIAIVALLLMALPAAATAEQEFSDLSESHWAYENVMTMERAGIVAGYPDGSFRPEGTVTYGEFIKLSVVAVTGEDPGTAAAPAHWAENYYDAARALFWFDETQIAKEDLPLEIPRKHMALIAGKVLFWDKMWNNLDPAQEGYDALLYSIKDVSEYSECVTEIITSYGQGILTGYPDKTFRPEGTASRAESAAVVNRLTDESARVLPNLAELQLNYDSKGKESLLVGTHILKGDNLALAMAAAWVEDVWEPFTESSLEWPGYHSAAFISGDVYITYPAGEYSTEHLEIYYRFPYTYNNTFYSYGHGILTEPDPETEKVRLKAALKFYVPEQADAIYERFSWVAAKNFQKNQSYLRVEYFDNYLVNFYTRFGIVNMTITEESEINRLDIVELEKGKIIESYMEDSKNR